MMCKSAYSLRLHVLFSWKPLWIVEKLVKLRYQRNYKHTKKSLIHTTNSYLNVMCVWFWVNHCKDLRKTLWCISVGWTLYLNSMYILKSPIRRVEKKKKKKEKIPLTHRMKFADTPLWFHFSVLNQPAVICSLCPRGPVGLPVPWQLL